MLLIQKGREPASLTAYRKTPFAYYDGCNKSDIRKKLLAEQGCLCAYCMRRIHEKNTKIEHWFPEAELSERGKLNYSNMLGVCSGHREGLPGKYDTCDASKGDTKLTLDPRRVDHIRRIKYRTKNGEIYSDDPALNRDLNEVLNLNCMEQSLPLNRKAVLDRVIQSLASAHKGREREWTVSDLLPFKRIYESAPNGERKEYAGIVLWYLEKRIRQCKS